MSNKKKSLGQLQVPLRAALAYAKLGWTSFFSLVTIKSENGKKIVQPYVAWKYGEGASSDPTVLKQQFRTGAAVCIDTGSAKLGVIDTDVDKDGETTLFCLEMEHGMLPKNHLRVRTATGGIHHIFRDPRSRLKSGSEDLGPGVDTRGVGGMIIAAGTKIVAPENWSQKAGRYRFENLDEFGVSSIAEINIDDIAEIPDWVVALAGDPGDDRARGLKKLREAKPSKPRQIPGPAFEAAYKTAEAFRDALALLDADDFDLYDDYSELLIAVTHASTVHDGGKEVFLDWATKNGTGKYAMDRDRIAKHWDANQRKRNMEGGLTVRTFNWLLAEAGHGDSNKIKWPPTDDLSVDEDLTAGAIELRKVKRTIKGLLRKAKKNADQEAANNAAELMAQYGLTEDDLNTQVAPSGSFDDFIAYLPEHKYIFKATGALWPSASVNSVLGVKATSVLDNANPAHCMTWAPGQPTLIKDRVRSNAGWIEATGKCTYNNFRLPPVFEGGDPKQAQPWLDHVARVFPVDSVEYAHLLKVLAYRVRYPGEKINHVIILGSDDQGIGKDSLLMPIEMILGEWNVASVSASLVMGDKYTPYLKSLLCKINEADDLGDDDRFAFYNRRKTWSVSPPKHLDVREMYLGLYYVDNVVLLVISSNNKTGLFLPPTDRRSFVAWSACARADFDAGYFQRLHDWYNEPDTVAHIAAYLATVNLTDFDPKATPPETAAWRDIVGANQTTEASLLGDLVARLSAIEPQPCFSLDELRVECLRDLTTFGDLHDLLNHSAKARILTHRIDDAGYTPVRNPDVKDGRWSTGLRQVVIYGPKRGMAERERLDAAQAHAGALAAQHRSERKAARARKEAGKWPN